MPDAKTSTLPMERQLMSLPMFLGMSQNDIHRLLACTTLSFHQYSEGKTLVREGDWCMKLSILTRGKVRVLTMPDDRSYSMAEELAAPYALQPEQLFGISTRYTRTFSAMTPCSLLDIDKNDVLKICSMYPIFHINLLNTVCTLAQRFAHTPWQHTDAGVRNRIVHFIDSHCLVPTGAKTLGIRMAHLAHELNESRNAVSAELHRMHREGLIVLKRETICVPHMQALKNSVQGSRKE